MATEKEEYTVNLRQIAQAVRITTAPNKDVLPWIKLARFGNLRSDLNCLRHDKNVLAITGIECDYDGEKISFEEACFYLGLYGVLAAVYTSPSHTVEKPRWRILCPTSKELDPSERGRFVARLNGIFRCALASESFTLSQSYFFGRVNDNPAHRVELIDGIPIDLHDELDATAAWSEAKPTKGSRAKHTRADAEHLSDDELFDQIRNRERWHIPVRTLIARQVTRGLSDAEILAQPEAWTWPSYTLDQTIADMQKLIDGARRKGFDQHHHSFTPLGDAKQELIIQAAGPIRQPTNVSSETSVPPSADAPAYGADALTVERLAALPPIEYGRQRKLEAKRLGIPVGLLDVEVTNARAALSDKMPDDDDDQKQPQRERIIEAVQDAKVTFWRDADGDAFATVPRGDEIRRYRVRSRSFAMVVRSLYGQANPVTGRNGVRPGSVSDLAMREALPAFEAMALAGELRTPNVRTMRHGNAVWLDLGDDKWRLVCISDEGWRMVDAADVPLIRPNGMHALPIPSRDPEALAKLRCLLNVADDADFRLIVAWLVATLNPSGPYPVLAVDGEEGSAKTTLCHMLRRLVDPNKASLRAPPRCEDDLLIAAQNGRVVALDNMSGIEPWLADSLCRVATGAGLGKRQLYSDGDEVLVSIARPVLLNGIPSLLARGDLASRALAITLQQILDEKRRPEADIWHDFEAAAPGILALLLDGLSMALKRLPGLKLDRLPRMADFARLACAAAPAFGWTEAEMLAAIEGNREAAVATVIEADPLAVAVQTIAAEAKPTEWWGTATQLLAAVNLRVPLDAQKERGWPKDGARLSGRLRRAAPALRRAGIEVIFPEKAGRAGRNIAIRFQSRPNSVPSVPSVPKPAISVPETGAAFRAIPPSL